MKKFYFPFALALLLCLQALNAQQLSRTDSVIYFLKQVKGLGSNDSILLTKAVDVITRSEPDSLEPLRIDTELKKLIPLVNEHNYAAVKGNLINTIAYGTQYDKEIIIGKGLIEQLKNCNTEFDKQILLNTLAVTRYPFRNSIRVNEGVDYYQRLANYFELANDSEAISICNYVLAGLYRVLGLKDKVIYYQKKSLTLLNKNQISKENSFLPVPTPNTGLVGYINRTAVLGGTLIDNEEPSKALPYLYEAKSIYEKVKDTVDISDGPYIYLQITRAKILLGADSVNYYFEKILKGLDSLGNQTYFGIYYQERCNYYYLQNKLDSAEYYNKLSSLEKDSAHLMFNTFSGFLTPAYYLALIRIKQHKYTEAIELLKNESAELLKVNMRRMALKEWLLLASVYKLSNDFENATVVLENYNALQKQILTEENKSRSVSFETEQQIDLLNKQREQQQQEISRQKLIRNWITGGLAVVFMFSMIILFQRNRISKEKKRSEVLLLNILPSEVAEELKVKGTADAKKFDDVTVMFTDFKNFTQISEMLSPAELVAEIHKCFKAFDNIISAHNIEKIKTIGDAYMCAGGLPVINKTNAEDVVQAAMEIQDFMQKHKVDRKSSGLPVFEMRIGIHTGAVVAGIVGVKKFAYDIWGDTVNIASRMESSGEAGKVNISGSTYELVKDKFKCTHRGKISAKNKGEVDMYFVESIF